MPGAATADAERPTLDKWAMAQDSVPWYRYEGDENLAGPDPGVENEAVGDADAVKSTTAGLKNIKRIMSLPISATVQPGEDNADLSELYERLIGQWSDEMGHVVHIVGGESMREKSGSQPGVRFTPVAAERQRAAERFVAANVFTTPTFLLDTAVLRRIEPQGALERIQGVQASILGLLLNDDRLNRMTEMVALSGVISWRGSPGPMSVRPRESYAPAALFADVTSAIWSELAGPGPVRIDAFRRNLERAHIALLALKLSPPPAPPGPPIRRPGRSLPSADVGGEDIRAIARGELVAIDAEIAAALPRSADRETRLHSPISGRRSTGRCTRSGRLSRPRAQAARLLPNALDRGGGGRSYGQLRA